jgi:hypothetical protein
MDAVPRNTSLKAGFYSTHAVRFSFGSDYLPTRLKRRGRTLVLLFYAPLFVRVSQVPAVQVEAGKKDEGS